MSRQEFETEETGSRLSSKGALVGLSLSMLLSSLGTSIANVALPTLAQVFDTTFQGAQWIVLSYLLATTTLIVSVGRLGDIIGRQRLLIAGICLFTASSVLCGLASNLWMLIFARVAQGTGAATMMALTVALVSEIVPKTRTGSAMGLLGTMSAIGTALGPSLGGILIATISWRAIFLLNLPLGFLAIFLAYSCLPVDRREPQTARVEFDKAGTALLGMTLAAYSFAMTIGKGHFGWLNVVLLLFATAGACLFIRTELRAASPLIRLTAFRDLELSAGLAMSALVSTVMMAILVVGPFYLSLSLGLETVHVGLVLSVGPIVAAITGLPAGRMVDIHGAKIITTIGLLGITTGCFLLAFVPPTFGIPGYLVPIVTITSAYAMFQAANNTAVMTDISPDQRGTISGMLSLSRNLGLITGASVMGAVFAMALGTADIQTAHPDAVSTGLRITFGLAGILMLNAIAIASASRALAPRPAHRNQDLTDE